MIRLEVATARRSELIDITPRLRKAAMAAGTQEGICLVFCPHTTAGLTVNEGADPSVAEDMLEALERLVPRDGGWRHREGNAAAHIKASLLGSSVQVLVRDGDLVLGRWQAVLLCEFDGPRRREVWVRFAG